MGEGATSPISQATAEERRAQERFRIECPVTVTPRDPEVSMKGMKGRLLDIGSHGARLLMCDSLEVGSQVELELELPSPRRGATRIRFECTVSRSESQHEVAVNFRESGKFLRQELEDPGESREGQSVDAEEE